MLPNIYAIDLQIRRFCSNNKERRLSTRRVQNYSETVSTIVGLQPCLSFNLSVSLRLSVSAVCQACLCPSVSLLICVETLKQSHGPACLS